MRKILYSIILAACTLSLFAAEPGAKDTEKGLASLEGTVTDQVSGESLAGVKLMLEGYNIIRYSDFEGRFSIGNLSPGKYTVLVEYVSYDRKKLESITVDRQSPRKLVIELQPSTVKIGEN